MALADDVMTAVYLSIKDDIRVPDFCGRCNWSEDGPFAAQNMVRLSITDKDWHRVFHTPQVQVLFHGSCLAMEFQTMERTKGELRLLDRHQEELSKVCAILDNRHGFFTNELLEAGGQQARDICKKPNSTVRSVVSGLDMLQQYRSHPPIPAEYLASHVIYELKGIYADADPAVDLPGKDVVRRMAAFKESALDRFAYMVDLYEEAMGARGLQPDGLDF